MKEREELQKAVEQRDRLLSRVRQLEGENAELCKDRSETFTRMRAKYMPVKCCRLFARVYSDSCEAAVWTYAHTDADDEEG
ncbi:hypothetical protein P4O66_010746 [Electrophorus voltai]|uniref:Uncharacterized protein n=1 Tax=Electrophorus voltai TaxID=2609070 RepID=A0AAD8Z8F8_9TELE|nr:hypothetical protein P4O66_010746 [Electrophorus voltai]